MTNSIPFHLIHFINDYPRVIFNTLFGLSTNFWMAISTRFLLGSLCGILGPMRVHLFLNIWVPKDLINICMCVLLVYEMFAWWLDMHRPDWDGWTCTELKESCFFLDSCHYGPVVYHRSKVVLYLHDKIW